MLNSLKSALYTALWTFVGSVALLSVGWLQSFAGWASSSGHTPLPGLSTVGYAVVSALISSASGLVAFVVRAAQEKNVIPGTPPVFATSSGTVGANEFITSPTDLLEPPTPPAPAVQAPSSPDIAATLAAITARLDKLDPPAP